MGKNAGIEIAAGVAILALFVAVGCDPAFDPFQENDRYVFSIYGYLDASADTQWVRVTPVRESLTLLPETVAATVTLEHLGSGTTAVLHDSLFAFFHDVQAYNFWTTMELQPQETYRLTAEGSDGTASQVTVTLPEDFPTPRLHIADPHIDAPDVVYIEGVERLADVQVLHQYRPAPGRASVYGVPHIQDTIRTAPAAYDVVIREEDEAEYIRRHFPGGIGPGINKQVFVAATGPGWHPFGLIDDKVVSLPEGVSNVENGVGYLAGIVSKTIPYESCYEGGALVACPLEE